MLSRLLLLPAFMFAFALSISAQQTVFVPSCVGTAALDTAKFVAIKATVGSTNSATIKLPYKLDPTKRCKVNTLTLTSNITLDNTDGSGIAITNGQTLTVAGPIVAPSGLLWINALAGQGTISFTGVFYPTNNVLWWATNTTPGTTDMTAAAQAALTATGGRGNVYFPSGSYLITNTLTVPHFTGRLIPVEIKGDGPFQSNLINKASANKPTLLIDGDLINVRGLGFWGDENFPNDGIKISVGGRNYIQNNSFFVKGNAIFLEQAQSVQILNNYGSISSGSGLPPVGVTTPIASFAATNAFVYCNMPTDGFVNHLVVADNMNENYSYQLYCNTSGSGAGLSWNIVNNQFEGSASGVYLNSVQNFEISGNYMGEGGTGYTIETVNCRYGRIGPNYMHFVAVDSKVNTVKLTDTQNTVLAGAIYRIYLTGLSAGNKADGTFTDRIQDESSDHKLSLDNVTNDFTVPLSTLNWQIGFPIWRSDTTNVSLYPGAPLGTKILKKTPTPGASEGSVATTGATTGALVQTVGTGPDPVVLPDYADPDAADFRITMLSSGTSDEKVSIASITNANPAVITTLGAHHFATGQNVTIAAVSGTIGTAVNGARVATVLSANTFSIPVNTTSSSVFIVAEATVTGPATYKVEWKIKGGGVYADLTNTTSTTELAHLIQREGASGPVIAFQMRWPTGVTYVAGDQWTLTGVIVPVWSIIGSYAKGLVTIDPASINANTVSSQTFTLTGAAVGDSLTLNPPAAGLTAGLVVQQAFVSSANTITIVFQNTTGAPIDAVSASWTYQLMR